MLYLLEPIFKENEDPLSPNSYRQKKLLEEAVKSYKKVWDAQFHKLEDIKKMQYRFMLGEGTADVVFILRRFTENFGSNKLLSLDELTIENICFGAKECPRILGKWGYVTVSRL